MIKKYYKKYQEIINYIIFGVLTTIINMGTYYLLVFTILDANVPIQLQIANVTSWIACVTFAYITNKKFVFKSSNKSLKKEATQFYISRIATLLLDMSLMFILVSVCHFNDKIMKILVQIIVVLGNYIISKLIVFKKN